jgi:soluble cytochrome b562
MSLFQSVVCLSVMLGCASLPQSVAYAQPPQHVPFDLANHMKNMKLAYRAASNSDTIQAFKVAYLKLKTLSLQAAQHPYDGSMDEQALYQQGLKQLQLDYQAIDAALSRQDLAAAKLALTRVRQTEKTYHQKLEI